MSKNYYLNNLINNLVDYGITLEELKTNWKYAGGDKDRHDRYFKLCYREEDRPEPRFTCLCEHDIVENCYITDGTRFIVLGNCCIKRFIPKCTRTCEVCGEPHKNRKDNRCNLCRELCKCGAKCYKYEKCYTCYYGKPCETCGKLHLNKKVNRCDTCRIGICDECDRKCRPCFEKCYTCAYLKK